MNSKAIRLGCIFLITAMLMIPVLDGIWITTVKADTSNGTTLYVGGSGPGNYATIQSAIDDASNGDTVFVYSGTYYENVVVNKSISLIGEDRNSTIIAGWDVDRAIVVNSDWVVVRGFTITAYGAGNGGISFEGSNNNTIAGNTIAHNNYGGISFEGSNNNTIAGNTITNNSVYGIYLYYGSDGNTVTGNTITHNGGNGIVLSSGSDNTVTGNTITNNSGGGIYLDHFDGNTVMGNTVTHNNGDGIKLYYGSNNTVMGNTVTHNNEDGIKLYIGSDGNTVMGNTVTHNSVYGIYLYYGPDGNTVTGNTVTHNGDGIYLSGSDGNTVTGNTVTHNNEDGIKIYSGSDNTVTGNTVTHNSVNGIYLYYGSDGNTVTGNTVTHNNQHGIYLRSSDNTVTGNTVTHNGDGIYLSGSDGNTVTGNTITNNSGAGIYLSGSDGNAFHHNNFINNLQHANTFSVGANAWDNGYPSGGNYWDDYTGIDDNGDDIGDVPYFIPGGDNLDRYPLITPYNLTINQQPTCSLSASPASGIAPLTVTFTITASDPDGTIATWGLDINNDGTPDYTGSGNPPSTRQHSYTSQGTYTAKLTVTDNQGATDTITVAITVSSPGGTHTFYVGGSGPGNYSTIQSAINAANNGDTVFVYSGTYYESVTISKLINLIGENKEKTIIDSNLVVIVIENNARINGFTIKNGVYGIECENPISPIIENNIFTNNKGLCIMIWDSLSNPVISNNFFVNNSHGCIQLPSGGEISNNTFSKNGDGIFNDAGGIDDCILILGSSQKIIIDNTFVNNNAFGIVASTSYSNTVISNNIISGNVYGIWDWRNSKFLIKNNTISNNTIGIVLDYSSNNSLIYHNNFIDNGQNAYDEGNNTWDNGYPSGGNYWDDYTGIDANGDDIGDVPYFIPGGDNLDRYPLMNPYNMTINQPPTCTLSASPTSGIVPLTVTFTLSASDPDGTIATWGLDINNDGTLDYTGSGNPPSTRQHSYTSQGTYTAKLTVTDNQGATASTTKIITVNPPSQNQPPTCTLAATPTSGVVPLTVTFTLSANDPDGTIATWGLDINNDGASDYTGSENPPSTQQHTYISQGTYTATLIVTDNQGATSTNIVTITVSPPGNQLPTCTLSASPTSGIVPLTVTFTLIASDPDGSISIWSLDIDNDGTSDYAGSGTPPSTKQHIYQTMGTYIANLTVTDNQGALASDTIVITVSQASQNQPPTCTLTGGPASGIVPLMVTFTLAASDSDGTIASWTLDIDNDGTSDYTGSGSPPSTQQHTYTMQGTYTAKFTVIDNEESTGTDTVIISVVSTIDDKTPLKNLNILFIAQVPPGVWGSTKNCGQASSLMVFCYWNKENPTMEGIKDIDDWLYETYGDPINDYDGHYTNRSKLVSLARDYAGFLDTYSDTEWDLGDIKTEIDNDHPVIVAIAGEITGWYQENEEWYSYPRNYPEGHWLVVKGYSAGYMITHDPGTSHGKSFYYNNSDFLSAMNNWGDTDFKGAAVIILPSTLEAFFAYGPQNPTVGEEVIFDSSSSTGEIATYYWDFGDSISSNLKNPVHTYGDTGSYTVTLTITDNNGYTDTYSKLITVTTDDDGDGTPGFGFLSLMVSFLVLLFLAERKRKHVYK